MSEWAEVESLDEVPGPGRGLTEFTIGLRFEDLPTTVIHQAKRVLLEAISWPFLGGRRPEGRRRP